MLLRKVIYWFIVCKGLAFFQIFIYLDFKEYLLCHKCPENGILHVFPIYSLELILFPENMNGWFVLSVCPLIQDAKIFGNHIKNGPLSCQYHFNIICNPFKQRGWCYKLPVYSYLVHWICPNSGSVSLTPWVSFCHLLLALFASFSLGT